MLQIKATMDYQRVYAELISSRQKLERRKSDNCYYESRHIVLTCLGGENTDSNKVLLTAREHFIAHRLLTKIHPKNQKLLFAVGAFRMDKTRARKLTSRQIEAARKAHAEAASLRQKALAAEGRHNSQTEEFREAQSKRNRDFAAEGRHPSQTEEFREAQSKRATEHNKALAAEGKHPKQTVQEREAQAKRNKAIVTCPHCGKSGGTAGMKRWHFDNCKLNKET